MKYEILPSIGPVAAGWRLGINTGIMMPLSLAAIVDPVFFEACRRTPITIDVGGLKYFITPTHFILAFFLLVFSIVFGLSFLILKYGRFPWEGDPSCPREFCAGYWRGPLIGGLGLAAAYCVASQIIPNATTSLSLMLGVIIFTLAGDIKTTKLYKNHAENNITLNDVKSSRERNRDRYWAYRTMRSVYVTSED
jgi:hypothetical protein